MNCVSCGKELPHQANFCRYCGAKQVWAASSAAPASSVAPVPAPEPLPQPTPAISQPYVATVSPQVSQPSSQVPPQVQPQVQLQIPSQQYAYQPMPVDTSSGFGYGVLGFFFPAIGLILYLVWKTDHPRRAHSAGVGALIGMIAQVVFWFVVYAVLYGAVQSMSTY